jgi:membrane associated rhomboid family serine protease
VRLPRVRQIEILGAYLPSTVFGLVALTFATTLLGMLLRSTDFPLLNLGALVPGLVLRGQLWRLVTWAFLEPDPINFIFGLLLLAMIGRDLSQAWGHWRFVGRYLGFAAGIGAATCLLAFSPFVAAFPYRTIWALGDTMLVAWAIQFPSRQVLLYFVIPLSGRNLIYATVGATAVLAVFSGTPIPYIPHFLGMGAMLALARYPSLRLIWLRVLLALERQKRPRRDSPLHVVRREGDEPPRWLH